MNHFDRKDIIKVLKTLVSNATTMRTYVLGEDVPALTDVCFTDAVNSAERMIRMLEEEQKGEHHGS